MSQKEPHTKKEKQRAKNKKDYILSNQVKEQMENVDIATPEFVSEELVAPSADGESSGFMQKREMMKRSIGERKNRAKDRWKKSAFASGSGGRGR